MKHSPGQNPSLGHNSPPRQKTLAVVLMLQLHIDHQKWYKAFRTYVTSSKKVDLSNRTQQQIQRPIERLFQQEGVLPLHLSVCPSNSYRLVTRKHKGVQKKNKICANITIQWVLLTDFGMVHLSVCFFHFVFRFSTFVQIIQNNMS